jgi:hypothetical protein
LEQRLALRGDMEPGLKPRQRSRGRRFSRRILELKSHSRTVLYSQAGWSPWQNFDFSNI